MWRFLSRLQGRTLSSWGMGGRVGGGWEEGRGSRQSRSPETGSAQSRAGPRLGCSDVIIVFIGGEVRLGSEGPCAAGRLRSVRGPVVAPAEQGQS